MSDEQAPDDSQRPQRDRLLFILHNAAPPRTTNSRAIASHARIWQTDRKRRDQRANAQQEAGYAKSLVGWRARDSQQNPDDNAAMTLSLQPTAGLRVDPFNALPVAQNQDVMYTTDYFVHVWSLQKASHFDALLGYNSYRAICWPIAQQDDMLFDATVAVSRSAWCLAQKTSPADDGFVLHHRGAAMSKLRGRLALSTPNENVLFTIDFLANTAYMFQDHAAFNIHLAAFRTAFAGYIATTSSGNADASVLSHRLKTWEALDAYRRGMDPLRQKLTDLQSHAYETIFEPTYVHPSSPWHHRSVLSAAAPGFLELANLYSVSIELVEVSVNIDHILQNNFLETLSGPLTEHITRPLRKILTSDLVSELELRVAYALLAICYYIERDRPSAAPTTSGSGSALFSAAPTTSGSGSALFSADRRADSVILDALAQSYLNKKRDPGDCSFLERRCWMWCALVLGSTLLSIELDGEYTPDDEILLQRLRGKGHIILVAASQYLVGEPSQAREEGGKRDWPTVEADFLAKNFLCTPALLTLWQQTWETTMDRQRNWEAAGALTVCAPQLAAEGDEADIVDVEYMVLREGRESLPKI
ncbi:hypothetical protein H2200_003186 [Cladophialophora chaetospira]|uniref:Transcription factor domain-containing protein n=1 Tax=Cladophialophora chaetospira TaxID=386627 RepID=A0AA38XGY6_9EURO|nr:hypothetical protein H2200_003186 [Cladophialophora chaetospira]